METLNPAIFSSPARGSGQKSSRMLITFFRPESAGCLHLFRHKALANIAICSSFSEVAIFCASDYSEQSREHSMFSWSNLNLNTVKPVLSGHRIKRTVAKGPKFISLIYFK